MSEQHWTEKYIGRPWVENEYDCASLVMDVALDKLGVKIDIPGEREWRKMEPGQIADLGYEYARKTNEPKEFDAVLMRIQGSTRDLGSHIGVAAFIEQKIWVLHNLAGMGVIFTPETSLSRMHLAVEGYYQWRTT